MQLVEIKMCATSFYFPFFFLSLMQFALKREMSGGREAGELRPNDSF